MTIWYFLLVPIVWALIAKIIWKKQITNTEWLVQTLAALPITIVLIIASANWNKLDSYFYHGEITDKKRIEDSHLESYRCNCRTSCSGVGKTRTCSTVCSTCWRTRYTIDWYAYSTIGSFHLSGDDSLYSSIWKKPDPKIYTSVKIGEKCTNSKMFENYIKGRPDSLFNNKGKLGEHSAHSLPLYPKIYDIFRSSQVKNTGVSGLKDQEIKTELDNYLKKGNIPNINLIFVSTSDVNYRQLLEAEWLGGKINDVTIVISVENNKVLWAETFTYGKSKGNHLLNSKISDELRNLELRPKEIVGKIVSVVKKEYKQVNIEDFKYLDKFEDPNPYFLSFLILLQLAISVFLTRYFIKHDFSFK